MLGPNAAVLGRRVRDLLPGAELHGPRGAQGDWDRAYDRVVPHLAELFVAGRPIVGVCASGILVRALAPLLDDKHQEPPVVALAEDGSVAVPLLGGHHGANRIARILAEALSGIAAITTAGDLRLGLALDEPPPGWRIADPERMKPIAAALIAGRPVALHDARGCADWLRAGSVAWTDAAEFAVRVTDSRVADGETALVFHPPMLALGIGCERGCAADEIATLAEESLAAAGLAAASVAAIVSVELKLDEKGIHALADRLGVPARFFPAERLLAETPRLSERSAAAFRATGCWGVAEGAALAAAGTDGSLVVAKRKSRRATCAVARAAAPLDAGAIGRPRGRLAIVGIGPGDAAWRTPEAGALIAEASDIVGYGLYLDLLGRATAGKTLHPGRLGAETERACRALDLAAAGKSVALVSSGDAGIYGLAALVFELIDSERRRDWVAIDIVVSPGVSAMQAAAARAGAPLGHDFCAISLSDLMTPWPAIRARLEAAAAGDFVVALYNPRSARRQAGLREAAAIFLDHRPPPTPVLIARDVGRADESWRVARLDALAAAEIDMLTVVIIGSSTTRVIAGEPPRLYTPRGYQLSPSLPRSPERPVGAGRPGREPRASDDAVALDPRFRGGDA
ncbi:MAG TPA: precorrin-3B C(17)-methyltransferase [Stellaceae bacterium]|nr:precorrin-3B C(17)-methyltransferase [Stellaceae bacterium]